jgi:hypothetical protein
MMAAPEAAVLPADDPASAVQRLLERHTRRPSPHSDLCSCGGTWHVQQRGSFLIDGCAVRQSAAELWARCFRRRYTPSGDGEV